MNLEVEKRAITLGKFILKTKQTVRQTAVVFGISKSTVHFDVAKRLPKINYDLYSKVNKILQFNFAEKHIRGGLSTQNKYLKIKKSI